MRALVLNAPNTSFELTTVPDPIAGPGEAVARVLTCGAGLTIQHVKSGRAPAKFPLIIGHEITAEIVEAGAGVANVKTGDPVTAFFYLCCGHCRYCLNKLEPLCDNLIGHVGRQCDGGYADYIKLPAHIFIPLPEGLDHTAHPAEIGVVTDAIATPFKVLRRADIRKGETVAVFGAGGGLGIHQLMMAAWAGARVIAVERAKDKFDACRKAGAHDVVDASAGNVVEALMELTGGHGIDVGIDYVSAAQTLEAGANALAKRGRLVTLGGAGQPFQLMANQLLQKELSILGSRYVTRAEVIESLDIVARGEIWPMVTEIRPMEEAEELHAKVEAGEVIGRAALRIAA